MSSSAGAPVADTTARYLPFGEWRTEPTAELTDRGYASHKHNNMGSDNIGLIYMNARYYVPGIARFASADSIIPNPANPQSYNRYSYVFNQPLNYTDPSGHIACEELGTEECDEDGNYIDSDPGLIVFSVADSVEDETWTGAEMGAVYQGAYDVGVALARDINARSGQKDLSQFGESPSRDITPEEAFLSVFGGPIEFQKVGRRCEDDTGDFCYAQTQNSRLIYVYTNIYEGSNKGKSKIPNLATSERWAVHEIGHAFESRVNGRVGEWGYVRSQIPDELLNRDGFAGPFDGWQQSTSYGSGEIFTDMFVGWTYSQWNTGEYLIDAKAKAEFMNTNMIEWISITRR